MRRVDDSGNSQLSANDLAVQFGASWSANDVAPQRRAGIAANSELQERELLKRAHRRCAARDEPTTRPRGS
jgi:hypothetical protein